jgi:hypothetical protein
MKSKLHGLLGAIALLCILSFWISTVVSELFLGLEQVTTVKQAILTGMGVLIPAMAATGGSGLALGKGRGGRLVGVKSLRMRWVAANGLLVLNFRDGLRMSGRVMPKRTSPAGTP